MTEPKATLYTPKWNDARERAQTVDAATRDVFATLLDHIEQGWQVLRPLQLWFEQHSAEADAGDDYAHLLTFSEGSVTDVFLQVSGGVADLVPGRPGWVEEADPADVDGWVDAFCQNLAVLRIASAGAAVPEPFRDLTQSAVRVVEGGWCRLLSALLGAVGELVPIAEDPAIKWG
jgi:hypothetical protein